MSSGKSATDIINRMCSVRERKAWQAKGAGLSECFMSLWLWSRAGKVVCEKGLLVPEDNNVVTWENKD